MNYSVETTYPFSLDEKKGSALLWRQEDDKHILLARHDMYVMNAFSREIFTLCDGTKSIKDLAMYCSDTYQVPLEAALEQICEFVQFAVSRELMGIREQND